MGCASVGLLDLWLGGVFDGVVVLSRLVVCFGHRLVLLLLRRVNLNLKVVDWLFVRKLYRKRGMLLVCEQLELLVLDSLHSNNVVDFQKGDQVVRVGAQLLLPVNLFLQLLLLSPV